MVAFTYMGTKKSLAPTIASLCRPLSQGPFFDLFSGISAVGSAVAPHRQIWCNDAQVFSRTLTEALYLSNEDRPRVREIAAAIERFGGAHLKVLIGAAVADVEEEKRVLIGGSPLEQIRMQTSLFVAAQGRSAAWRRLYGHCLFSTLYAGTYLGLAQAMQIDSIRHGADAAISAGAISSEEHRWALLAMCRAIAFVSNSTGHFAQYLTPSELNIKRVTAKRRRCVWSCWANALREMSAVGDRGWRKANRVFHGDALDVLRAIKHEREMPAVIYADPPYTSDQYSRYYHLLETAILYDYPVTSGKGLYRPDRFRSSFSILTEVQSSFRGMIEAAANTGSNLVISYPSRGLLAEPLQQIPAMLASHFGQVERPIIIPHKHSTLGASKGRQTEDVEECIFVARGTGRGMSVRLLP